MSVMPTHEFEAMTKKRVIAEARQGMEYCDAAISRYLDISIAGRDIALLVLKTLLGQKMRIVRRQVSAGTEGTLSAGGVEEIEKGLTDYYLRCFQKIGELKRRSHARGFFTEKDKGHLTGELDVYIQDFIRGLMREYGIASGSYRQRSRRENEPAKAQSGRHVGYERLMERIRRHETGFDKQQGLLSSARGIVSSRDLRPVLESI
jgi:hypothetical protein